MEKNDSKNESRIPHGLLWIIVIFFFVATAGISYEKYQTKMVQQTIDKSVNAFTQGDFDTANATIATVRGDTAAYQAQIIAESSKFLNPDPKIKLEGAELIKSNYLSLEGQPEFQTGTIGRLFDYLQGASNELFAAVFTGAPFESFYVPNDRLATLNNLAEHSLTLKRTTAALFQIGAFHAGKITSHYDKRNVLSEVELVTEVSAIQDVLKEVDELYPNEKTTLPTSVFAGLYDTQFFFNRGYLYGVLSLVNKTNLKDAEYSFGQVHRIYDSQVNPQGTGPALLESRLPFADINLALFTMAANEEHAVEQVNAILFEAIERIQKNPSLHTKFIMSYLSSISKQKSNLPWISGPRLRAIAEKSPDFKKFLIANGWVF